MKKLFCRFTLLLLLMIIGRAVAANASASAVAEVDPLEAALAENVMVARVNLAMPPQVLEAEKLFSRGEILNAQLAYQAALTYIFADKQTIANSGGDLVPNTPENAAANAALAEFLLGKLLTLSALTGENADLRAQISAWLTSSSSPSPLLRLFLYRAYAELSLRLGKKADALAATTKTGLWRDFLILAPLPNERGHAFPLDLIGETALPDFTAEIGGKKNPVRWRFFHTDDPLAYLDLAAIHTPNVEALAYVAVIIQSEKNRAAALRCGSDDALAIFVNGQELLREDVERRADFAQSQIGITLHAGLNLIMFKVGQAQDDWGLYAGITAPDGSELTGVENITANFDTERRPEILEALAKNFTHTASSSLSIERGALDFFTAHLKENPHDARALYLYCSLMAQRDIFGRHAQTLRQKMLSAMALAPNETIYPQALAELSDESKRFKADRDENMRRLALLKILDLDPDNAYALTELGAYYLTAQQSPLAARPYLEKALAQNRLSPITNLRLHDLYLTNGWDERALLLLENLSKRYSGMPELQVRYGECLLKQGRAAAALTAYLAALKNNHLNFTATIAAKNLYCSTGQPGKAITLLRNYLTLAPYNLAARRELAEILLTATTPATLAEALKLINETLTISPAHPDFLRLQSRALTAAGKTAEAETALMTALATAPAAGDLRAYLDYRGKNPPSLLTEIPDLAEYVAATSPLTALAAENGEALYLLNEQVDELYGDGTKRRGVRTLTKILTPTAAEKTRRFPIWYDQETEEVLIVNLRALHADGSVSEAQVIPVNRSGERQVLVAMFPNLNPGDVVETAYILQQNRPDFFGDYFGHLQRFRKPEFTAHSRYVLRAPADKKLYFHQSPEVAPPQITTQENTREYVWEMRDLPALPQAAFAPPVNELSPTVQISTFADWNELARWYWGLIKSQGHATPEITAQVKALLNDNDTPRQNLAALYEWLTTEVRNNMWVFGVHGFKPYNAGAIFTRRFGDCKDKTLLLNVMAGVAGFKAYPVLIRAIDFDAGRGREDLTLPILSHFNHCISLIELPANADDAHGEKLFLDGTMSYRNLAGLPFTITGAQAVVVREDGAELIATAENSPADNSWQENVVLTLEENGNADLAFIARATGQTSVYLRAWFRNEQTWDQVLKAVGAEKYGTLAAAVVNDVNLDLDDTDVTELDARLRLRDYLKMQGTEISLRLPIPLLSGEFGKDGTLPTKFAAFAKYSQRDTDILLPMLMRVERQIKVEYPDRWELQNVLTPLNLQHEFGDLTAEFNLSSNYVEIKYNLVLKKIRITAAEYPAWRRFCLAADRLLNLDLQFKK